jgi:hypothetical protein
LTQILEINIRSGKEIYGILRKFEEFSAHGKKVEINLLGAELQYL